jgi:hypothetical protein
MSTESSAKTSRPDHPERRSGNHVAARAGGVERLAAASAGAAGADRLNDNQAAVVQHKEMGGVGLHNVGLVDTCFLMLVE